MLTSHVSSEYQTEEGRTGLPRQLLHIHEVAQTGVPARGIPPLKITWDMVYVTDEGYLGFEFRNRPALSALFKEIFIRRAAADYVLIEHLDRLSRHATWHQGYLLEQIEKAGCQAVFWRAFRFRRSSARVMGAISEQGMKHEIQRMISGQILKAKDGPTSQPGRRLWLHVRQLQGPTPGTAQALIPIRLTPGKCAGYALGLQLPDLRTSHPLRDRHNDERGPLALL